MRYYGEYAEDVIHLDEILKKYLPVILIFAAFALYYWQMQPMNQYNGGAGNYDGKFYYLMSLQASEFTYPLEAEKPFANRILMPIITGTLNAITGAEILQLYFIINLLLMFVTCLLLFNYWDSYFGLLLFLIPFHNLLRWLFFYPVMVDYLFYLLLVIGLFLIKKENYKALVYLSFFIVLTREAGLIIPLLALRKSLYPLLAGIAAMGITYLLSAGTGNYNFIDAAILSLNSLSVGQLINTIIISFGMMIVFAKFNITKDEKIFLAVIALLSIIGGVNTVRFIYWSAPVVILMILNGTKRLKHYQKVLLLLPQIYLLHTFEGYFTDLTAYRLWGGLQLYQPDYKLLVLMLLISTGYYFIRKWKIKE